MRTSPILLMLALTTAPARADLLVASRGGHQVLRFSDAGAPLGVFAADPALVSPVGITFGPDGHLYVAAGDTDRVLRFDGTTGAPLGVFTSGATLLSPRNLNFGPDGAFYVADGFLDQVLRFDGVTGAFDRVFVQDPALHGPTSFTFGPDGNLYVVSVLTNRVLRYDGASGAPLGEFVRAALSQPHDLAFGPDGNLYVTNSLSGLVQRFRGDSGDFVGTFVNDPALRQPLGLTFGPDGNLYVANQGGNEVRRYDGSTGAPAGVVVSVGSGGLSAPSFLAFTPGGLGLTATALPGRPVLRVAVRGVQPGGAALLLQGAPGEGRHPSCESLDVGLTEPSVASTRIADESGGVVVDLQSAAPGAASSLVALDAARCQASPPVPVVLP